MEKVIKMNTKCINSIIILCLMTVCALCTAQCPARRIVKDNKPTIEPYLYDSYALNEIIFEPEKSHVIEIEFTAFVGQHYKLVFTTSDFVEDVKLNIYDKSQRSKNRTKIYDSENGIEKHWVFEPPRAGNYFINYEIPKSANGQKKTACTVMLIGYKE